MQRYLNGIFNQKLVFNFFAETGELDGEGCFESGQLSGDPASGGLNLGLLDLNFFLVLNSFCRQFGGFVFGFFGFN